MSTDEKTIVVAPDWTAPKYSTGQMAKRASDPTWRGRRLILIEDFPVHFTETLSWRINAKTESGFDLLEFFRRDIASEIEADDFAASEEVDQ